MGETEVSDQRNSSRMRNRRVHLANERTFLAWIRTSIGIMAFGFVVERFALFSRQFSHFLSETNSAVPRGTVSYTGYSSILGMLLVGLGAIMAVVSFIRFKKVEKQIDEDAYRPSILLDVLLTITVVSVAVFILLVLLHSI